MQYNKYIINICMSNNLHHIYIDPLNIINYNIHNK